jgi:hypothetical protein
MRTDVSDACLNCGAELAGAFCSACGQRAIPAYPTVREMAGDAWEELSGYDGRFARTVRLLLRHPGALTREVLEGRRARYISPVRLYLVASVAYFLIAAASPNVTPPPNPQVPGTTVKIDLSTSDPALPSLTPEQRDQLLKALDRAPWWAAPLLRSAFTSPREFRARFLTYFPRVLFALVPVFAAIVALFYRRRRFLVPLVLSLHLHAAVFVVFSLTELSNFPRHVGFAAVCGVIAFVFIVAYSLVAFRRVFGESWPRTLAKCMGIAILYAVAGAGGMLLTLLWAALSG